MAKDSTNPITRREALTACAATAVGVALPGTAPDAEGAAARPKPPPSG
jgi:hypothetical protein